MPKISATKNTQTQISNTNVFQFGNSTWHKGRLWLWPGKVNWQSFFFQETRPNQQKVKNKDNNKAQLWGDMSWLPKTQRQMQRQLDNILN